MSVTMLLRIFVPIGWLPSRASGPLGQGMRRLPFAFIA
jgi:hypothetical protein